MSQLPFRTQLYKALKSPLLPILGPLKTQRRRWRRAKAACLRKVAQSSHFPGNVVPSIADWTVNATNRADEALIVPVDAPTTIHFYPSQGINETAPPSYLQITPHQEPAMFVASIPDGRVWGSGAAVITPDNFLVGDLCRQMEPASIHHHRIFERVRLPPITHIEGTVAVLLTEGSGNYFHWMCEAAPRFGLLRDAFPDVPVDFYAVPKPLHGFHREVLTKLGVAEEKFLPIDDHVQIQAQRLLVPSLPVGACVSARAYRFLRDLFPAESARPPFRRIYVSRGNSVYRRVIDEDTLIAFLRPYGFETVALEGMSVAEQAATFAEAEVVIGPHGAGMTNLVFCTPGAKVVELFSPYYVNPCYWTTAHLVGLKHFHVLGRGRPQSGFNPDWGEVDIEVNFTALKALLKEAAIDPR